MSRLPAGSLSDAAKEALAIEAASVSQQAALKQCWRLQSRQKWQDLVATVDSYMFTMYTSGSEPTPMHICAVTSQTVCQCCGKTGHNKADCRMKDCVCLKCGTKGHMSIACRGGGGNGDKGGGKLKGKSKDKNFSQRMYHGKSSSKVCLCCGRKGHVKSHCRFKDEKCAVCGEVGHLKAVCRASNKWSEQRRGRRE